MPQSSLKMCKTLCHMVKRSCFSLKIFGKIIQRRWILRPNHCPARDKDWQGIAKISNAPLSPGLGNIFGLFTADFAEGHCVIEPIIQHLPAGHEEGVPLARLEPASNEG
jgi:hypothetical protein